MYSMVWLLTLPMAYLRARVVPGDPATTDGAIAGSFTYNGAVGLAPNLDNGAQSMGTLILARLWTSG